MADDLRIRLQVEEQVGPTPGVGGPAQVAGASSAVRSNAVSKLGSSLAFERSASFWELDMERIQHRLYHSISRSSLRLFTGMAIGELVGTGLGEGFVGSLGSRVVTGFAFGGPTGAAIGALHTLVEGMMEMVRESGRKIEEQNKKLAELRNDMKEEKRTRYYDDVKREEAFQRELENIRTESMKLARELQYQTFQYMRN